MARQTILTGYTDILDALLRKCITNSSVCLERLQAAGYPGGLTTVKDYMPPINILYLQSGSW